MDTTEIEGHLRPAVIEIDGEQSQLILNGGYSWACADMALERKLNEFKSEVTSLQYFPDYVRAVTEMTAEHFGARIIYMPPALKNSAPEGAVY